QASSREFACNTTTMTARILAKIIQSGCSLNSCSARTRHTNSKLMKKFLTLLLAVVFVASASAQKTLNVVATLPDYGAIAQAIGGDKVKVTTLARGTEDPHFVDAKPSFIRVLNKADLLIEGGADLEVGWLPPLVSGARNRAIVPGGPGNLKLSQFVQLLDVPTAPV